MKLFQYLSVFVIILPFFNCELIAQQNHAQISGYVYNPDNDPALYSTVVLLNQDSVLVKGALSQEDGSFVLENVAPGEYFVQIRNIDYQTYISSSITISTNEIK